MNLTLDSKIEAILFFKGEPVTYKKLAEILSVSREEIAEAVKILEEKLAGRGLQLIIKEDSVMLGTNKDLSHLLEHMRKDELGRELSKASLETLAVILYKDGATRGDIDYIRGVNSSFIIRNMLIRGLIERATDPEDTRKYIYKPTFDLMSFLGVSSLAELPDYAAMKEILENNAKEAENNDQI